MNRGFEKMKLESTDKVLQNIELIGRLFPNTLTEVIKGYDSDHKPIIEKAIDFDVLRQELSDVLVEGPTERYQMNWPDKRKSILLANTPTNMTLRPCREESVDFDNTQNLYIEGNNLEVLKLLQETYLNKVKMIYIDPPYNTGKDSFVYDDSFNVDEKCFGEMSGKYDEDGNVVFDIKENNEVNGKYHTDWLNMLYPRLKLAKDMLSDEGVIFISINDKEIYNLRKICNEIFGEKNFVANFIWNSDGHTDNQYDIKVNHEYICMYCKDSYKVDIGSVVDPNVRAESNLWKGFAENSITKNGPANPPSEVIIPKGFPSKLENGIIKSNMPDESFFRDVQIQRYITRQITDKYNVSYPIRFEDVKIENGKTKNEMKCYTGWANINKLKSFIKNSFNPILEPDGSEVSFYLSDRGVIYYYKTRKKAQNILSVLRNFGTTEQMRSELENDGIFFTYPKPLKLLSYLCRIGLENENDILMDFFSGSATAAHAVMQLNAEDGGKRQFIMVQLPEETPEKSEARKAGYDTICEIGKERIRRAGKKIKEESPDTTKDLDTGFRVLKLDSSNMKDVYYKPVAYTQVSLDDMSENIKEGRTAEDLLFQVMLELGELLSSDIEQKIIAGKTVYSVGQGNIIACFDTDVTDEVVIAIAKEKPYYAVFRDSSIASDSVAANFEQIFETYSPTTIRKVL